MYSPVAKGVAAAGVAATGFALSDRDRRDAAAGVANGSIRFVRAFGWGAAVSFDYKYRCVRERHRTQHALSALCFALQRWVALAKPRVSVLHVSDESKNM